MQRANQARACFEHLMKHGVLSLSNCRLLSRHFIFACLNPFIQDRAPQLVIFLVLSDVVDRVLYPLIVELLAQLNIVILLLLRFDYYIYRAIDSFTVRA